MITKDYKPAMKPVLRDGRRYKRVDGKLVEIERGKPTIEVSREYFVALQTSGPFSSTEQVTLQDNLTGQSICPALYWFNDTPETRRLLKVIERSN